jgi:transposase-like protein
MAGQPLARRATRVADPWRDGRVGIAETIDRKCEECLTVLHFPAGHRVLLHTGNAPGCFKQAIKRRACVGCIFPNGHFCSRLVGARRAETGEEWTDRRFLGMDVLRETLEVEREDELKLVTVS